MPENIEKALSHFGAGRKEMEHLVIHPGEAQVSRTWASPGLGYTRQCLTERVRILASIDPHADTS